MPSLGTPQDTQIPREAPHPYRPPPQILTAPVLLLSALQSGMILDSCTIQLLILSLLRRSTARAKRGGHGRGGGGVTPKGPEPPPQPPPFPKGLQLP